jgi:stage III sporulation protein AC
VSSVNIDVIFKIAGIGIIAAVLYHVLDQAGRKEAGFAVGLVGVIIIFLMVIQLVADFFNSVRTMFQL